MNIDELPAGRELDALVAERVMGWHITDAIKKPGQDDYGVAPGQVGVLWVVRVPDYSTDIAAAWQVVERLIKLDAFVSLDYDFQNVDSEKWSVTFITRKAIDCESGETAPLAICRAALKAVGVTEA